MRWGEPCVIDLFRHLSLNKMKGFLPKCVEAHAPVNSYSQNYSHLWIKWLFLASFVGKLSLAKRSLPSRTFSCRGRASPSRTSHQGTHSSSLSYPMEVPRLFSQRCMIFSSQHKNVWRIPTIHFSTPYPTPPTIFLYRHDSQKSEHNHFPCSADHIKKLFMGQLLTFFERYDGSCPQHLY